MMTSLLRLASVPDMDNDFALLKIKVEQALRTNGKSSPNYKKKRSYNLFEHG